MNEKPNKEQRERAADHAMARSVSAFVIRRPLDPATTMVAAGIGLAAGVVTAYLTSIWLARAPLEPGRPRSRTRG